MDSFTFSKTCREFGHANVVSTLGVTPHPFEKILATPILLRRHVRQSTVYLAISKTLNLHVPMTGKISWKWLRITSFNLGNI